MPNGKKLRKKLRQLEAQAKVTDAEVAVLIERSDRVVRRLREVAARNV